MLTFTGNCYDIAALIKVHGQIIGTDWDIDREGTTSTVTFFDLLPQDAERLQQEANRQQCLQV